MGQISRYEDLTDMRVNASDGLDGPRQARGFRSSDAKT